MKNNFLIVAIVVILLILLGAGGFLMLNQNKATPSNKTANQDNKPLANEQTSKSLLDLINLGQNLRCSFSTKVDNGSTEGTVYISGKNVRGDFTLKTTTGKPMQTSMIKKDNTSYIWGDSMDKKGIKMTVDFEKLSENKQASQYVDPNQKVNYNCIPWKVDNSLFIPPTDIEFTDMTSLMMPKTTTNQETQTPSAFNPCNQIEDATAKAACESALKNAGQ